MRAVPEWIGKTDDSPIPERVRLRIFDRSLGLCGCCLVRIAPRDLRFDHLEALCNGGEHREGNLQAVHVWCHRNKTKDDVARKAAVARKRKRHLLGKPKSRRPLPGGKTSPWKRTFNHGWVRR